MVLLLPGLPMVLLALKFGYIKASLAKSWKPSKGLLAGSRKSLLVREANREMRQHMGLGGLREHLAKPVESAPAVDTVSETNNAEKS